MQKPELMETNPTRDDDDQTAYDYRNEQEEERAAVPEAITPWYSSDNADAIRQDETPSPAYLAQQRQPLQFTTRELTAIRAALLAHIPTMVSAGGYLTCISARTKVDTMLQTAAQQAQDDAHNARVWQQVEENHAARVAGIKPAEPMTQEQPPGLMSYQPQDLENLSVRELRDLLQPYGTPNRHGKTKRELVHVAQQIQKAGQPCEARR